MFEEVLFYATLSLFAIADLAGIYLGIMLAIYKGKYRGWESPWRTLSRNVFFLAISLLLLLGYRAEMFTAITGVILFSVVALPNAVYIILNDRRHCIAHGKEWRFI